MQSPECNEFDYAWRYAGRVYYEITSLCNLRCVHCYATFQSRPDFVDAVSLARFHDGLVALGTCNAVVTGGEPTLHPNFRDIVDNCAKKASVVITTNGTVLSISEAAELLRACPTVLLQVSIDALSLETQARIRGPGARGRPLALVTGLAELGLNRQVGMSVTVMQANASEVQPLVNLARRLNLASVHFPALVCSGLGRRNWHAIAPSPSVQIETDEYLAAAMANHGAATRISSGRVQQVLSRTILGTACDCLSVITLKVTPKGFVVPCPMCDDDQHRIGNVAEPDIVESLSARIDAAIPRFRKQAAYMGGECPDCPVHTYCMGRFCDACGLVNPSPVCADAQACSVRKHHFAAAIAALHRHSGIQREGLS